MTPRALRDALTNAFDFFVDAGLILYANEVAFAPERVWWHGAAPVPFFLESRIANADQYLYWLRHGLYSALLFDGALLQLSYGLADGDVASHRLAYVPCPVDVDEQLIREGEPVSEVVSLYLEARAASAIVMRSPVRFDFEPDLLGTGHPAAHMTINGPACRIACVAPLHPYRFLDFVFRHFYPVLWAAQRAWFEEATKRRLGERVLTDDDAQGIHVMWSAH